MRQIKFKYYMQHEDTGYVTSKIFELEELESYDGFQEPHRYFTFKRCQFTGLFDKQGVEIYEGDIVVEKSYPFYGNAIEITDSNQECDELNYIGVVVYDNGYYIDLTVISNRVRGCAVGYSLYDYEHLEVIGSIYENPELLEMK